jgi:Uma2 family endonuclease
MTITTLKFPKNLQLNHEQFQELALTNQELRLELTAQGELIIMPPTGGNTGRRNADLTYQLQAWNRQFQLGVVFDSSTTFRLPNGAERSPDVAWVELERWQALTLAEQDSFPPLCPDFVIELSSKTDSLILLRKKMEEYLENGCHLGWLINPQLRQVEVYQYEQSPIILDAPKLMTAEAILPNFCLNLLTIW